MSTEEPLNERENTLKTKQICRFCLSQQIEKLGSIYQRDARLKSSAPLPVQVMACASIEVFSNDGMPSKVCCHCRLLFERAYRFKQMCKRAETLLKQYPLTGKWPIPLAKPKFPKLLPNVTSTGQQIQQQQQPKPSTSVTKTTTQTASNATFNNHNNQQQQKITDFIAPKKLLNANPVDSLEPPVPMRMKKEKLDEETTNFLNKVENNEELSMDDVQRLIAAADDEHVELLENDSSSVLVATLSQPASNQMASKSNPKLLNKSSIRILNKEADVVLEPRLSAPQLKRDVDGKMAMVTEILDPATPYEPAEIEQAVTNVTAVESIVFPCPHCERSFPLRQLRDIHMVNHTRSRSFHCTDCEKSFFSKYDLQKHNLIHSGDRPFKCTVCEKGFTRATLLHRHEKTHTDIPKFIRKPFLSKEQMKKHAERHQKNRPYNCGVCNKSFAFKQGLERLEVIHLREQPYPCQYCDFSFSTPRKLARHFTAHGKHRILVANYVSVANPSTFQKLQLIQKEELDARKAAADMNAPKLITLDFPTLEKPAPVLPVNSSGNIGTYKKKKKKTDKKKKKDKKKKSKHQDSPPSAAATASTKIPKEKYNNNELDAKARKAAADMNAPKLTTLDFATLGGSGSKTNSSTWVKGVTSKKKQREVENRKSKVAPAPVLPGKSSGNIGTSATTLNNTNSEGVTEKKKDKKKKSKRQDSPPSAAATASTKIPKEKYNNNELDAKARKAAADMNAPKLTTLDFPTLGGSGSKTNSSTWVKGVTSEKKQREVENRKSKVAPAPVLPGKSSGNIGTSATTLNNTNSEGVTEKKKDKKKKKDKEKKANVKTLHPQQQQQQVLKLLKKKNNNNKNRPENANLNKVASSTSTHISNNTNESGANRPPPGFSASNTNGRIHKGVGAMKPPPGFQSNVIVNSVAKSPNNLTFTSSLGESYSIVPTHSYIQPTEAITRNQKLVGHFKGCLDTPEALDEFRQITQKFREGIYKAPAYYEHCQAALKDKFDRIFPELLAFLPDINKQQALYLVHSQRLKSLSTEQRKKLPNLDVCSICKQVLLSGDFENHKKLHSLKTDFPTLNSTGSNSKATTGNRK